MSLIMHPSDCIGLTVVEQGIFDRLSATLRHSKLETQIRVVGGWVRDKLLGKTCLSIDITLDNILATEFVYKFREYLLSMGEPALEICVFDSNNADQSKHLETARVCLFGVWIHFFDLRTENSCITSEQTFCMPLADAYRRDLTINSLFYNINTDLLEDFTMRGISDLKSGKIVTISPPKASFLDDPLRILRAIRFGARFEFTLDEDLRVAATCDDVKNALVAKVSRERIGSEIDLMISGNQPVKAMTYISELTLFSIVFSLAPEPVSAIPDACESLCVSYLDTAWNLICLVGESTFTNRQRRLTLYAAFFLPLRNTYYREKEDKKIPVVNYIIHESLKRKAKFAEKVLGLHRASCTLSLLIPDLVSSENIQVNDHDCMENLTDVPVSSRVRGLIGFIVREVKDNWRVALLISTMLHPIDIDDTADKYSELCKRRDLFNTVENSIIDLSLENELICGEDEYSTAG